MHKSHTFTHETTITLIIVSKSCSYISFSIYLFLNKCLQIFIFLNRCRSYNAIAGKPIAIQFIPALGIIGFAVFGLEPLVRLSRNLFLQEVSILLHVCQNRLNSINCWFSVPWCFQSTDRSWKKSSSRYILTSYIQPMLLWTGVMLICRYLSGLTSLFAVEVCHFLFVNTLA